MKLPRPDRRPGQFRFGARSSRNGLPPRAPNGRRGPPPVDRGRLYVALGDVDRAFAAFQQACDGESFATDLEIAPDYDAIRATTRSCAA